MLTLLISLLAPLSGVVGLTLSNGYFTTFVSVHMKLAGYSSGMIGLVQAAHFLGMFVSAFHVEKFISRFGHIRTFAFFISLNTTCILLQSFSDHPYYWMFLRAMTGSSIAGMYVVIESWLLGKSTFETRGAILSFYTISLYGALTVSQLFFRLIPFEGETPYIISSLFSAVSSIPVILVYKYHPETSELSQISLKKLFFTSPYGFSGCLFSGMILSSIYSFIPSYALETSLPVSLVMTSTIAGGSLLQWPIGRLSDFFNRRLILILVCLLAILPCAALTLANGETPHLIYSLLFALGGLCFTIYPLSISQVCDRLNPQDFTAATGALLVTYGLGSVFGPPLASYFMEAYSTNFLFVYFMILVTIVAIAGAYSFLFRPKVPVPEQEPFVFVPRTTPVAYELDPRTTYEETGEQ